MNSIWKLLPASLLVAVLALAGCGGGGDDEMTPMPTPEEQCTADGGTYADGNCKSAEQVAAEGAIAAAYMAAAGLDATSDDAAVSAAESLIMAAQTAIAALSMDEAAENAAMLATAESLAEAWRAALTAQAAADAAKTAEEQRLAEEEAARLAQEAEEARQAAAAAAAMAAKLYAAIGNAPLGTVRTTVYADDNISVSPDTGTTTAVLMEDEDAMVDALAGWDGMRFTAAPNDGGTYEAVVYSNVGEPMEGAMFNDSANGGYTLNDDNQIADVTSVTDYAGLVASSSFDQSAGTKTFELAENREYLEFAGTFNGVPGTYTCTPTAIATDRDTCGSTVAASGFTLIGGTWTFEPNDPEQRLMNVPDAIYASYGWWIHKSEDGDPAAVTAFAVNKGAVAAASGVTALMGTATYKGGAAGKYALQSSTGGTNDSGHFTADATLEADFGDDMITGTINNFTGADGMSRNWSVMLNETDISDAGVIDGTDADNAQVGTVWTIDGTAAAKSGQWSGTLWENDATSTVPQVATGIFHSTYGTDGSMVGAFGANEE